MDLISQLKLQESCDKKKKNLIESVGSGVPVWTTHLSTAFMWLMYLYSVWVYKLKWTVSDLTQHMASCSCSSASRRPMHILFPMPKGTWAKGLIVPYSRSQRSGLNCFPSSKYSSLEPSAWLFIIKTVCKWMKITIKAFVFFAVLWISLTNHK